MVFLVDECHDERNEITTRSVLYLEDNAVAAFVMAGWSIKMVDNFVVSVNSILILF